MSETYTGQCVGGPNDGEHMAWPEQRRPVTLMPPRQPTDPDAPIVTRTGYYVWGDDDNRWHWQEPFGASGDTKGGNDG